MIKKAISPPDLGKVYQVVFGTRLIGGVVFLLLLSLLLQPIERAYAVEETPENVSVIPVDNDALANEAPAIDAPVDSSLSPLVTSEEVPVVNLPTDASTSIPVLDIQATASSVEEIIASDNEDSSTTIITLVGQTNSSDVIVDELDSTIDNATTSSTTMENIVPDSDNFSRTTVVQATTSDNLLVTETAVTSIEPADNVADNTVGELSVAQSFVTDESQIQFDKDACILLADNQFYCQKKDLNNTDRADGLYALPDQDGDLEIYLQKDGQLTQISHNTLDDSSPSFDAVSNTIVWQRLVSDRYQIISYDIETGKEEQLTNDSVNNMEPNRSGEYTAWQHWDNNSWQIVLADSQTRTQLTKTTDNNITPSIRNGLVVWYQLAKDGNQTIQLYNLKTKEFTTITDTSGGAISNPRMVVMYDSKSDNGDVVTKGYDLITGQIIDLGTRPVELPDKIPTPDSTGETRALIQAKTNTKEDIVVSDGRVISDNFDPNSEPNYATSTGPISELDLVITATATTSASELTARELNDSLSLVATTSTSTIEELTLDLATTSPSLSPANELDLIVPPYNPITSSSSNNEIATSTDPTS